jgi:hypothetical protein
MGENSSDEDVAIPRQTPRRVNILPVPPVPPMQFFQQQMPQPAPGPYLGNLPMLRPDVLAGLAPHIRQQILDRFKN